MATRRKSRAAVPLHDYGDEQLNVGERQCEWPSCTNEGAHRAPRSRDELNTYRWFCLDHVRSYNKAWNYYDGMSDDEVEEDVRRDTVWHRPTWQLGTKLGPDAINLADDPFNLFREGRASGNGANGQKKNGHEDTGIPVRPPISADEERAYKVLDIEYPVSAEAIKIRYKSLVKEHHPDANKGAKESEERLKVINAAYSVLRDTLNS